MAVKMAMIIIPTRIQTMQKIRAKNDLGARSPYLNSQGMFLPSVPDFDLLSLDNNLLYKVKYDT